MREVEKLAGHIQAIAKQSIGQTEDQHSQDPGRNRLVTVHEKQNT
jgi:hypothetical protein